MIKGVTESGFKFSIDPKKVKDYRFVKLVGESKKDPSVLPQAINLALGDDLEAKLISHVEDKGYVDFEILSNEFAEMLMAINKAEETKN